MRHVVVADAELHRPGGQRLHRIGAEAGRHDDRAVGHAAHGDRQADRHLQVGAGDRQLVAAHLQVHALPAPGSAPVRLVAARPAVASASARTSRSQRNFTVGPFP